MTRWNLTGGAAHIIDITNASRTMLLDLETATWDGDLLDLFSVDHCLLPAVVPSCGVVAEATLLGATVPLAGIAGDQQAALFGQGCFASGEMKATYGTGTFVATSRVGQRAPTWFVPPSSDRPSGGRHRRRSAGRGRCAPGGRRSNGQRLPEQDRESWRQAVRRATLPG